MSDNTKSNNAPPTGRRVFCKSDDTAPAVSKKISMAALPDSTNGFPVRVFCKRKIAVNTAVKATAIATSRLKNIAPATDIVCIPSFRDNRNEVSLYINELKEFQDKAISFSGKDDNAKLQQFNISSKTDIKICAGAIANAARQQEQGLMLQAIGQDAVFNAIRAVAVAREYLEDKKDAIDLFCKIEFTQVRLEGRHEDTTAIQVTIYLHEGRIVHADGSASVSGSGAGNNNKAAAAAVDTDAVEMATEETS